MPTTGSAASATGVPLSAPLRTWMEGAFQESLSEVRVYTDSPLALVLGARALAMGNSVHFAPGQWNPHSPGGRFVLAHELAHVLQQRAGRVHGGAGAGLHVDTDPELEAEADWAGARAARGEQVRLSRPARHAAWRAHPQHASFEAAVVQCLPGEDVIDTYRHVAFLRFGIKPGSDMQVGAFTYHFDDHSRIEVVEGFISDIPVVPWVRVAPDTLTPLIKNAGDDNGHLIADSLGGPAHGANFVGMTPWLNRAFDDQTSQTPAATWSRAEAWIRNYKAANPTHQLGMRVEVGYPNFQQNENYFRPTGLRLFVRDHQLRAQFDNPWTLAGVDHPNNPGIVFDNRTNLQILSGFTIDF